MENFAEGLNDDLIEEEKKPQIITMFVKRCPTLWVIRNT